MGQKKDTKHTLTLTYSHTKALTLVMHEQLASGEHEGEKFRLIMDVFGRGMRLEYQEHYLSVDTSDLVSALMDEALKHIKAEG